MSTLSRFVFGRNLPWRPPERVRAAISEQQAQSEILIGWVQFGLVCFFLALYTIAPKTSAGTSFAPVPWVLGTYILFSLLRLGLSYRRFLPPWFLVISVISDMALLLGLIWTFHLQYEQPPSFYLKAPTILYIFIFISLRALRFEPGYVLVTGIVAAGGWVGLTLYVIFSDPSNPMITRNYVEYLTSNSVLIGAEVDKVISILVVTGVLAVALVRARRMLTVAVAESTVAQDLSRFVSPEIADRVATSETPIRPGDGEVKEASVLFTDIEGFSTLSEGMTPDVLAQTLNDYFAAVSEVLARHGGAINQFQGDAMLITFNTVKPDPDHARHAVQTALEIQALTRARRFGPAGALLRTRCGVNTGTVVSGAVGTETMMLHTVHGDEVNIAARLEPLNKEFGTYVLVSQQTAEACGTGFRFEPRGEITVRGRSRPTAVFTVLDGPEDAEDGAEARE
ncbi:MAG: adenylate/guanylate cyclase domain-containing protein [Hyphomicrobiales bacterium]|nr:adenylate/guanylate cyclase domain-containing protein [Hyphomicrobiales bacterium]MCP5371841.1 adenylate/guanylate cyclase domain-containing protein [Hyphomicrobiales bacterium]